VPVLQEKFKNSKIIALHVEENFQPLYPEIPAFCGTDSALVQEFLEKEIPEIDASLIRIIEWRPSLNYYKTGYVKLLSDAVEYIKREDAGKRTVAAFGKRWFKNFFRNLRNIQKTLLYREMNIPVIVCGSGPCLEKALPLVRQLQEKCLIIAASSSALALVHGGVTADIVITTDGGSWALRHIYNCFRRSVSVSQHGWFMDNSTSGNDTVSGLKDQVFLAANLCAALPSQCGSLPQLILNDGSLWQSVVLRELSLPSVIIPQRGTVTASAIDLALLLTSGNIYLAGMDLSVMDIRTHVRPYGFDYLFSGDADRFSPVYSQIFFRSGHIRSGGGFGVYAAWFKKQLLSWPKRIFSLTDSNEIFSSALSVETSVKKTTGDFFKIDYKDAVQFYEKGKAALLSALKDSRYAVKLKKELTPLLFHDVKEVTEDELKAAVDEAVHV